ncbi:MAG: hypothetical protein ACR2JO_01685 [Mycobacteriales bacterium]
MSPGRKSRPGANRAATSSQRLGIDNDEDTPTGRQSTGDAPPAVRPSALTQGEASTLDRCEQTIDKGITSFVEVGTALLQIREDRLYRTTYRLTADDRFAAHRDAISARNLGDLGRAIESLTAARNALLSDEDLAGALDALYARPELAGFLKLGGDDVR